MQTPCFIVHKELVDRQLALLRTALDTYWENGLIAYSYKTNSLPWIVDYYDRQGCYAEVVSDDEYMLGKQLGVEKDRFVYNGPAKSRESFLEALRNGCIVNIDTNREIDWLDELPPQGNYRLGIRVNFDIEKVCPGHSACGDEGGRFGFCYENGKLKEALERIRSKGFHISCLHLHTSSRTRGVAVYEAIAQMACQIVKEYELQPEYLDIGGGYFGGLANRPQFSDYLRQVSGILAQVFDKKRTTLIVEPGMSLIGPAVSYVAEVIDVKDTTYGRFAVTDGSRIHIDPLMSKKSYFYRVEQQDPSAPVLPLQTVCGFTCMEPDRLFRMEDLPELSVGDRIVFEKVGAYTMCLAPLFIKYFPTVYLQEGDRLRVIREKWGPQAYCQGSKLGE